LAERLILLAGDVEVAVLFQCALGAVPPLLVIGGGNDIGREERLDVVGGSLRAEAADAILDQRDGVIGHFLLQRGSRFDFLDGDVVRGEGRKRFRRVGKLHDMAALRLEIDDDTFVGAVPILDLAESPTAV